MPTNTSSPLWSWRAAWHTIISFAEYLVAIVHRPRESILRLQLVRASAHFLSILGAVLHPENPLVEILAEGGRVLRNIAPADVKIVVPIIISLGVRGMAAERLLYDRGDDEARDQGAVRIRTN